MYKWPFRLIEVSRAPYVEIDEPLAAFSDCPLVPARLSRHVAGITETWASVSTRKRRPVLSSVMKSDSLCGPTEATVDPVRSFPGSVDTWQTWQTVSTQGYTFLLQSRISCGTNRCSCQTRGVFACNWRTLPVGQWLLEVQFHWMPSTTCQPRETVFYSPLSTMRLAGSEPILGVGT